MSPCDGCDGSGCGRCGFSGQLGDGRAGPSQSVAVELGTPTVIIEEPGQSPRIMLAVQPHDTP